MHFAEAAVHIDFRFDLAAPLSGVPTSFHCLSKTKTLLNSPPLALVPLLLSVSTFSLPSYL